MELLATDVGLAAFALAGLMGVLGSVVIFVVLVDLALLYRRRGPPLALIALPSPQDPPRGRILPIDFEARRRWFVYEQAFTVFWLALGQRDRDARDEVKWN